MVNKFYDIDNYERDIQNNKLKNIKLSKIKNINKIKLLDVYLDRLVAINNNKIVNDQKQITIQKKQINEFAVFDYKELNKYLLLFQNTIDSKQIFPVSITINGQEYAHIYSYDEQTDKLLLNVDKLLVKDNFIDFLNYIITYKIAVDKVILSSEELWQVFEIYYSKTYNQDIIIEDDKQRIRK